MPTSHDLRHDTMMSPPIEDLLHRAGSKFALVILSAKRAREISSYFNQLGEGLGAIVPPQVTSVARKPLSIAYEEIGNGKIVLSRVSDQELTTESEDVAVEGVQSGDSEIAQGPGDVVDYSDLSGRSEGE